MKKIIQPIFISFFLILLIQCTMKSTKTAEELQEEIRLVELEFTQMAAEKGIAEAFYFYADENAVLFRNQLLIEGKEAIKTYLHKTDYNNVTLVWTPTKIEVAESGDLAYTYGDFVYSKKNEDGSVDSQKGIFHNVWKRQLDGSWKYVWD